MDWNDDDPEEQEDGPVAVARALSGADEEQPESEPEPPQADEEGSPQQDIEYQKGAPDNGSQYAQPAESDSTADQTSDSYADEAGDQFAGSAAGSNGGSGQQVGASSSTLPQAPQFGDNAANYQAMERRYAQFNPADYKPSIGRRIAAALSGGAVAFGSRNPAAGMKVAESVNDAPLNRARQQLQADVTPIQQRINDVNSQNSQQQRVYQNSRQAANDAALNQQRQEHGEDYAAHAVQRDATIVPQSMRPVDPKNPLGPWQGTDVKGRVASNLGAPAWFLNSSEGKAAQAEATINNARAAGHPFTPEQEQVVRSGGKLTVKNPTNIRVPSAELQRYSDWKTTFQRENGRAPNAAEVESFGHVQNGNLTPNLRDRIEATKDAGFAKAQNQFNTDKDPGAYQGNLQAQQDAYEHRLEGATGSPIPHVTVTVDPKTGGVNWGSAQQQGGGSQGPAPAAQPQQQATQPQVQKMSNGKTLKVGDPFTTKSGRTGIVKGFNEKGQIIAE